MATKTVAVTVTTAATRLDAPGDGDGSGVTIYNNGSVTIYVGGSDVTTATGVPVAAGSSLDGTLPPGETLYGCVASGTCEVRVMQVGV